MDPEHFYWFWHLFYGLQLSLDLGKQNGVLRGASLPLKNSSLAVGCPTDFSKCLQFCHRHMQAFGSYRSLLWFRAYFRSSSGSFTLLNWTFQQCLKFLSPSFLRSIWEVQSVKNKGPFFLSHPFTRNEALFYLCFCSQHFSLKMLQSLKSEMSDLL